MATMTLTPPTLSPEELKELARLEREEASIFQSRSEIAAKQSVANVDLEKARERHDSECLSLASGNQADVQKSAAEILRLQALIAGLGQLIELKAGDIRKNSEAQNNLISKRLRLETEWNHTRLAEDVRVTQAKVKEIRESLELAEIAATAAVRARAAGVHGLDQ